MTIRKEINLDAPLTEAQKQMLEALKERPVQPDEDCPELTAEQLELKRENAELKRKNAELEEKIRRNSIAYSAVVIALLVVTCILGLVLPINSF